MQLIKTKILLLLILILMMEVETHKHRHEKSNHRRAVQEKNKYRKLILDHIQENFGLDNGILNQQLDPLTSQALNYLINEEGHNELLLSSDRDDIKHLKNIYETLKRDTYNLKYNLKLSQILICERINSLINENFRLTPRSELYQVVKENAKNLNEDKPATQQFFQLVATCMENNVVRVKKIKMWNRKI